MSFTIDSSGRLELPASLARGYASGPLALISHSSQHLLLAPATGASQVLLAGRLGELGVADLLSFFNLFRKTGVLHFDLDNGSKELFFESGEVVNATSTCPDEDLGAVLLELGKVEREALARVCRDSASRVPLGGAMVAAGLLDARELWQASRALVEKIVYNLFVHHKGSFTYCERPAESSELPRLSLHTQNLIMEGLRRIDESALFRSRIPSLDLRVVATSRADTNLTPAEQRLLAQLADQRRTVRELLRRAGLAEFEGLRLLYNLVGRGLVTVEEEVAPVDGELGEILTVYNGALAILFRRIAAVNPGFGRELGQFLRQLPQPYSFVFNDIVPGADGTLAGGQILANLAGLDEGDQRTLLVDALNELVCMECIAARRDLGIDESAPLVDRVQKICRRVRNLTGRKA